MSNGSKVPLARNMIQKLKRLRIPGILKIVDSVETDLLFAVATEPVVPLYSVLNEMNDDIKIWGLNSLLQTLYHTSTSCVHGNINIGSVYVNNAGEWLLGGLDVATSADESILYTDGGLLPGLDKYAPPETRKNGWQGARNNPQVIDTWQFGVLIGEVFNGLGSGVATRKGQIPSLQLFNLIKILCNPNATQRPTIAKLLANKSAMQAFHSELTYISSALQGLSISSDYSFGEFLEKVNVLDDKIPKAYINNKILPELVKCQSLGKGRVRSLTTIIKLAKNMEETEFKKIVSPLIVEQFASSDRAIRMELLTAMPNYIQYLDRKIVSDKIFGHFSTGFSDTEPLIREQSVKSVLTIIDKLSDRQINGDLLRLLAKTQNDTQADIRANTTILLGKVADKFSASTRSGVLVAAFGRALKDPHVPSRIAALLALSATAVYFTPQECCSKLIGTLGPALLDKDRSVRDQAALTMDRFMKIVQNQVDRLNAKDAESVASAPADENGGFFKLTSLTVGLSRDAPQRTSSAPIAGQPTLGQTMNEAELAKPVQTIVSIQPSADPWNSFDDPFSPQDEEEPDRRGFDDVDTFTDSAPQPQTNQPIPTRSFSQPTRTANRPAKTPAQSTTKGALKLKPKDKSRMALEPEVSNDENDAWDSWN